MLFVFLLTIHTLPLPPPKLDKNYQKSKESTKSHSWLPTTPFIFLRKLRNTTNLSLEKFWPFEFSTVKFHPKFTKPYVNSSPIHPRHNPTKSHPKQPRNSTKKPFLEFFHEHFKKLILNLSQHIIELFHLQTKTHL